MNIENMTINEIEARMAEIATEMNNDGADIDALTEEVRKMNERKETLKKDAEKRQALRNAVASGAGKTVRTFDEEKREKVEYDAASPEYRRAFMKNLLGESKEMTAEERSAWVHTTANTTAVLPTTMLNNIWDLVSSQHSIMGDITIYRTGTIIEVVKHTAIAQGDAATVNENAANDDEKNTFVKVTLSGNDFSKHVDVSYAMERMSIDALESYLTNEIANQIGAAMASDVIAQIGTDMDSGNKVNSAANNEVTFKELAALFGKLERAQNVTVYAKRSTVYKYLIGMVDSNKRPVFQSNAQAGAAGSIIVATIKIEDAVADNVILIGDPKNVVYNMVQDIMIESDRDIKKHVTTYSGYARGQGALVVPKSFAQLTVTTA
jgi:HK97 family phage major capsid protein